MAVAVPRISLSPALSDMKASLDNYKTNSRILRHEDGKPKTKGQLKLERTHADSLTRAMSLLVNKRT